VRFRPGYILKCRKYCFSAAEIPEFRIFRCGYINFAGVRGAVLRSGFSFVRVSDDTFSSHKVMRFDFRQKKSRFRACFLCFHSRNVLFEV